MKTIHTNAMTANEVTTLIKNFMGNPLHALSKDLHPLIIGKLFAEGTGAKYRHQLMGAAINSMFVEELAANIKFDRENPQQMIEQTIEYMTVMFKEQLEHFAAQPIALETATETHDEYYAKRDEKPEQADEEPAVSSEPSDDVPEEIVELLDAIADAMGGEGCGECDGCKRRAAKKAEAQQAND